MYSKDQQALATVNGDIDIEGDSVISGNIVYKSSDSKWIDEDDHMPTLTIGSNVTLHGSVILERPVDLKIENKDIKGKVIVSYADAK